MDDNTIHTTQKKPHERGAEDEQPSSKISIPSKKKKPNPELVVNATTQNTETDTHAITTTTNITTFTAVKEESPKPQRPKIGTVIWDDDGSGMLHGEFNVHRVYEPIQAIFQTLLSRCRVYGQEAWDLIHKTDERRDRVPAFTPIYNIYENGVTHPRLGEHNKYDTLWKVICDRAQKYVKDKVKEDKIPESEWEFLLDIAKKRNYKGICCICLAENPMGTTCTCGHTEIAIFVPCGHAVCASPCYLGFVKKNNTELEDEIIESNGKKYAIVGLKKLVATGQACPMCRTKIELVFRAEETYVPETLHEELRAIAKEIAENYYYV
jgi:hypothetical protein